MDSTIVPALSSLSYGIENRLVKIDCLFCLSVFGLMNTFVHIILLMQVVIARLSPVKTRSSYETHLT